MVDAGLTNFKVTRPLDVPLAEAILRARAEGVGGRAGGA
jgi:2-C-methyl-D-erythritol 4-phosphate cytidylyltransferase